MCLHFNVASAIASRDAGGEGRYLNMSLRGWPELIKSVRVFDPSEANSEPPARLRYVGFVSHTKLE